MPGAVLSTVLGFDRTTEFCAISWYWLILSVIVLSSVLLNLRLDSSSVFRKMFFGEAALCAYVPASTLEPASRLEAFTEVFF